MLVDCIGAFARYQCLYAIELMTQKQDLKVECNMKNTLITTNVGNVPTADAKENLIKKPLRKRGADVLLC